MGIPKEAIITKDAVNEIAKLTTPNFSGPKTLEIYGKIMMGTNTLVNPRRLL
jgi:hypothetical protein